VTHPFHPLYGIPLVLIGKRFNSHGTWILLKTDDGSVRSVPEAWTDLVAQAPEGIIGEERSYFRLEDLLELARYIKHFK
jgi:hypothetical protein